MVSPWEIYMVLQLDTVHSIAAAGASLFLLIGFFVATAYVVEFLGEPPCRKGRRLRNFIFAILSVTLILGSIVAFAPSTRNMCLILGIPAILNNEGVQSDLEEVYELGVDRVKEALTTD